jgi:hypothetical protein
MVFPSDETADSLVSVNIVEVQVPTGLVVEVEDLGVPLTEIVIKPTIPFVAGYDLYGPAGLEFCGQAASDEGVVRFHYVELTAGAWRVEYRSFHNFLFDTCGQPGTPIVSFGITPTLAASLMSDSPSSLLANPPGYSAQSMSSNAPPPPTYCPPGTHAGWMGATLVQEDNFWMPLVVIHAPYKGSASAQDGWSNSWSKAVSIGPYSTGFGDQISSSWKVGTGNGESYGQFQLVRWGLYANICKDNDTSQTTAFYCTGGNKCYVKIIDDTPNGYEDRQTYYFYGVHLTSDADDWINIWTRTDAGMTFHSEFVQKEGRQATTSGGSAEYMVGRQRFTTVGGSFAFDIPASPGKKFFLPVQLTVEARQSTETYYKYYFPAGYVWLFDYLGPISSGSGLAFCYAYDRDEAPDWICDCNGDAISADQNNGM